MRYFIVTAVVLAANLPLGASADEPPRAASDAPRPKRPGAPTPVPTWPNRPDPPPLTTVEYIDLRLRLANGRLAVQQVRKGAFHRFKATTLPRFGGKFAVNLYRGKRLLDLVRFNFPLTGGLTHAPLGMRGGMGTRFDVRLARGVSATVTVRVPWDRRIDRVTVSGHGVTTVDIDLSTVLPVGPPEPPKIRLNAAPKKLPARRTTRPARPNAPSPLYQKIL